MKRTLIGIYDTPESAQRALRELRAEGFSDAHVQTYAQGGGAEGDLYISGADVQGIERSGLGAGGIPAQPSTAAQVGGPTPGIDNVTAAGIGGLSGTPVTTTTDDELAHTALNDAYGRDALSRPADLPETGEHRGVFARIEDFFRHLFGGEERHEDFDRYHDAVTRGGTLVAVTVEDDSRFDIARDLMWRNGASNLNEDRVPTTSLNAPLASTASTMPDPGRASAGATHMTGVGAAGYRPDMERNLDDVPLDSDTTSDPARPPRTPL